jgi:hypothetical protein
MDRPVIISTEEKVLLSIYLIDGSAQSNPSARGPPMNCFSPSKHRSTA